MSRQTTTETTGVWGQLLHQSKASSRPRPSSILAAGMCRGQFLQTKCYVPRSMHCTLLLCGDLLPRGRARVSVLEGCI